MKRLSLVTALLFAWATGFTTAHAQTADSIPAAEAPAAQGDATPMTKKQRNERKQQQEHQEKTAKAQKSDADAFKHQDKAKDEQEKVSAPQSLFWHLYLKHGCGE